ncbi:hypothetical protein [Caldivirga maquilingensis]|uniref:ATPase AAA-type core domain-containing protein n=1 Tax=Caldivirga maquilingensis (strain ATCC 700844 / DSM 13496 / JCM 10307 / IC-167) TaxID=397948 RepID=A8MAQ5_CALMQ|nr:hypothetical protein [Caldivirga maquilingensis]ABW01091.1 hypothetical protein Cmaq_0243 [Caldivirga maquilingensis IC-167]
MMYKPFSEDLSCDEVKRIELMGESAIRAYRRVISIFKSGKPGLYMLMGDYGSGKTLIVRKATAGLSSGRVVVKSFKSINDADLSCSGGRAIMGYVIDSFELFFQNPQAYAELARNYVISVSQYYPVLLVVSLPLIIGDISGYGDVVNRVGEIPEGNKIRITFTPEETRSILGRLGISINEHVKPYILKTPGLGIRALSPGKGSDEVVEIIVI